MRPVFIKTFGCKVNYTESVAFSELISNAGFTPREMTGSSLPDEVQDQAPVVFVNSCCVTSEAERKAAQFTRRIRREYPGSEVLFTGCGARNHIAKQKYEDAGARVFDFYTQAFEWLEGQQEITSTNVTGQVDGASISAYEDSSGNQGWLPHQNGPDTDATSEPFTKSPEGENATLFESGIVERARSRTFIKVQDGCHNCCTFCIIPFVRPYASRPMAEILDEVDRRVSEGSCELVLTGINIGHYGTTPVDTLDNIASDKHWRRGKLYEKTPDHPSFFDLVDAILNRLPETSRLRISSIEPEDIEDRFYEQFSHPRMCPHLHLPLQSGSDEVLTEMRRLYTAAEYLTVADKFRDACPDGALTTDILVGFPSETEGHFRQTLDLCSELKFERIHGFPYSARPGTRAARMVQLPRTEVLERNRRLIAHCQPIADLRWKRFVGQTCRVLVEERHRGNWVGHGDAYQQVSISTESELMQGQLQELKLTDCEGSKFTGELIG